MSANQARLAEQDKGENNTQSLQTKVDKLTAELTEKDYQLKDSQRMNKEIKAKLFEAQKKSKTAEEDYLRVTQNMKPKVMQAIEHQKTLFQNFR